MNGEPTFRVSRRTTLVVLAAVFVLAVAACGSPKDASPTTESSMSVASTGASGSGSVQQGLDAYRACLQERGVENGARARACLVERRGKSDESIAGDAAIRGLDTHGAGDGCRLPYRPAGVGADRQGRLEGSDRRRRTAA